MSYDDSHPARNLEGPGVRRGGCADAAVVPAADEAALPDHQGCNSIDILRTALTNALTIAAGECIPKRVHNPCLNLNPNSIQMSIECLNCIPALLEDVVVPQRQVGAVTVPLLLLGDVHI